MQKAREINRHRRPRPKPHTPFTKRAFSIPTDTGLPPNGSPFMGKMMNHDVSVGGKGPNKEAATQYPQTVGPRVGSQAIMHEQTPPPNVSGRTPGPASGLVGPTGQGETAAK